MRYPDLVGQVFEGAVVVALFAPCGSSGKYGRTWTLRCPCGNLFQKTTNGIVGNETYRAKIRCRDCARRAQSENATRSNLQHGESGTYMHQLWLSINKRCSLEAGSAFKNYGGRGISVFKQWVSDYSAFADYIRKELGERPDAGHSLDRVDNDGNYEPGNLRWATPKQQIAALRAVCLGGDV